MMCRMKTCSRSANRRQLLCWGAMSAFLTALVLPSSVFGQSRYPTFGLPSSAYGASAVQDSSALRSGQPRSLSASQTSGARMVSSEPSGDAIHRVAHSQPSDTSSTQQPSAVQRELQRLYQQDGREMPPMQVPSGGFQRPPVQPTSIGSTPKRSVVDLMKGRDQRFDTVQTQPSARPAPTAPQQQSPPRTAAAVRPTGGRESKGGVLSGLFNWGRRTPQAAPLSQPPQEPNPYQPPTYKSQPRVRKPAPQPPQQPPATANRAPRLQLKSSPAQVKSPVPAATPQAVKPPVAAQTTEAPETPQTAKAPVAPKTVEAFDFIPLTEPVLAPPADEFFPEDVAETSPQPVASPQPKVAPQPVEEAPHVEELPQVVTAPEENPVVIPQPRNYAKELGLEPQRRQPVAVADEPELRPEIPVTPSADPLELGNLFPADDQPATLASDDADTFRLPVSINDAAPTVEMKANEPPSTPYTGRKLERGAFEQPVDVPDERTVKEKPSQVAATPSEPREPAPFFPSDEQALEADDIPEVDVASERETTLAPRVANAVSQPSVGTALSGSRMQQIAARDGVGLKGFCPVALRDERSLQDGKAAYISFYQSKAYYFASAQAKAAFDDNPVQYAPASNGNDVTLMALTGEVLEGSLDHAVWYKDRLYLFSSDENLKTFMAAPSAMAVK